LKHSTPPPSKADIRRFALLYDLGCVACGRHINIEIHHYLSGNKRIGHEATIPLCTWCHRGTANSGKSGVVMLALIGPSFHQHRRAFRAKYGSDAELLALVNKLIGVEA
jgi:hypothetical protein